MRGRFTSASILAGAATLVLASNALAVTVVQVQPSLGATIPTRRSSHRSL